MDKTMSRGHPWSACHHGTLIEQRLCCNTQTGTGVEQPATRTSLRLSSPPAAVTPYTSGNRPSTIGLKVRPASSAPEQSPTWKPTRKRKTPAPPAEPASRQQAKKNASYRRTKLAASMQLPPEQVLTKLRVRTQGARDRYNKTALAFFDRHGLKPTAPMTTVD